MNEAKGFLGRQGSFRQVGLINPGIFGVLGHPLRRFSFVIWMGLVWITFVGGGTESNAMLQISWDRPSSEVVVLKTFSKEELERKKSVTLKEKDPLEAAVQDSAQFVGPSLSRIVEETTSQLTAADRSTSDLLVLKSRAGREVLMPKAFLQKYPEIQIALRKNGKDLGNSAPRLVLPATSNSRIRSENILLEPMYVTELASVTLSSYEKRYGSFFLKRRTDPAAMRGEKLFLQNCVSCHTRPEAATRLMTSSALVEKVVQGAHPEVPGNHGLKGIFDKKAVRSIVSYVDAFRGESTGR